jgi:hypothetical protein
MIPKPKENADSADPAKTYENLSSDESRVFRALLELAIPGSASPDREFLQWIRAEVSAVSREVELSDTYFKKRLIPLLEAKVAQLPNSKDQATAEGFLTRWKNRGGGTTVIVTQ